MIEEQVGLNNYMATLDEKTSQLPPDLQREVVDFVQFLQAKARHRVTSANSTSPLHFPEVYSQLQGHLKQCEEDILALEENWDGEEGQTYTPDVITRARSLVLALFTELWHETSPFLPFPTLYPGIGGEIDVHLKTPAIELFLSVPENQDAAIPFYGDDFSGNIIKGVLIPEEIIEVLVSWLKIKIMNSM